MCYCIEKNMLLYKQIRNRAIIAEESNSCWVINVEESNNCDINFIFFFRMQANASKEEMDIGFYLFVLFSLNFSRWKT